MGYRGGTRTVLCKCPAYLNPPSNNPRQVALTLSGNGISSTTAPAPEVPEDAVALVLDDGSRDNDIGIGGTWEMLWLNRFAQCNNSLPARWSFEIYLAVMVNVGDEMVIAIFENTTGSYDPAPG